MVDIERGKVLYNTFRDFTVVKIVIMAHLMNLQNTSSSTARLQYNSGMFLGCRQVITTTPIICTASRSFQIAPTTSTAPSSLYAAGNYGKEETVSYSGTNTRA
jgi:hypothetical protein